MPILFSFRHNNGDRRIEWPASNVKSTVSGRPIVFWTSRPAPLLVKSRATQSMTEDFPSSIFAPLSTRVRVSLRRSCIQISLKWEIKLRGKNWRLLNLHYYTSGGVEENSLINTKLA